MILSFFVVVNFQLSCEFVISEILFVSFSVNMATGGEEMFEEGDELVLDAATEAQIDELFERLKSMSVRKRRSTLYGMMPSADESANGVQSVTSERVSDVQRSSESASDVYRSSDSASDVHRSSDSASDVQRSSDSASDRQRSSESVRARGDTNQTEQANGNVNRQAFTSVSIDQGIRKIKNFSGGKHPAPGELDYRRWRRSAMQIACDPDLTTNRKRVLVLQSLVGEAEDAVEIVRERTAVNIVKFLDTMYDNTDSPHERLVQFYRTTQKSQEVTSDYLASLYRELAGLVKAGVVEKENVNQLLVKQFVTGTADDDMVVRLRLKEDDAMEFEKLMLSVREEESRRKTRRARLKPVKSFVTTVGEEESRTCDREEQSEPTSRNEIVELKERMSNLECQAVKATPPPFFCYRCGLGGHFADKCANTPNSTLVAQKKEERRQYFANRKN